MSAKLNKNLKQFRNLFVLTKNFFFIKFLKGLYNRECETPIAKPPRIFVWENLPPGRENLRIFQPVINHIQYPSQVTV